MAKDPAVLWYWGDWHSGTSLLSRFLKGCYIDVLHAQFNNGRLSLEEIKTCLGSDFGPAWPTLQKKFKQDEKGLFFNERLETEKEKRQKYSESRSSNKRGKPKNPSSYDGTYVEHMKTHMENENENEIKDEVKIEVGKGVLRGKFSEPLNELEAGKTVEYVRITLHRDYDLARIETMWTAFCIQHENKPYPDREDKVNHFRNWFKTIPNESHKQSNSGGGKLGTSEARIKAAREF